MYWYMYTYNGACATCLDGVYRFHVIDRVYGLQLLSGCFAGPHLHSMLLVRPCVCCLCVPSVRVLSKYSMECTSMQLAYRPLSFSNLRMLTTRCPTSHPAVSA